MRYVLGMSVVFAASVAFLAAHLAYASYAGSEPLACGALVILVAGTATGLLFDCIVACFGLLLWVAGEATGRVDGLITRLRLR